MLRESAQPSVVASPLILVDDRAAEPVDRSTDCARTRAIERAVERERELERVARLVREVACAVLARELRIAPADVAAIARQLQAAVGTGNARTIDPLCGDVEFETPHGTATSTFAGRLAAALDRAA